MRASRPCLRGAVGTPHLRVHDLRHGFGARAVTAGVHPRTEMQPLGYRNMRMTVLYSEVEEAVLRATAEEMDRLLDAGEDAAATGKPGRFATAFAKRGRRCWKM